jgi:hypothetical protein
MPSLAAYPAMMQRGRRREGLRACRAAWLIGVTVREYREIEAGDGDHLVTSDIWERMVEVFGWPQRFEGPLDPRRGGPP